MRPRRPDRSRPAPRRRALHALAGLLALSAIQSVTAADDVDADFASPVVSVTAAQIDAANPRSTPASVGPAPEDRYYRVVDSPMSMLSGGRRWLSTHVNRNGPGGVWHVMSGGTADKPLQSRIWVKATCETTYDPDVGASFCKTSSDGRRNAFVKFPDDMSDVTPNLWFAGVYQAGGKKGSDLLAFVHEERVGGRHGRQPDGTDLGHQGRTRIGLAWSTDHGDTWEYLGRIIKPGNDYAGPHYNILGAPYIVRREWRAGDYENVPPGEEPSPSGEAYLYVYYVDSIRDTGSHVMGVSRAKLADVLDAARARSALGIDSLTGARDRPLWRKYYDAAELMVPDMDGVSFDGHFVSPSNGLDAQGRDSFATHALYHWSGTLHTQSIYSTLTDSYYLPFARMSWGGNDASVVLYKSRDGRRWTEWRTLSRSSARSQGQFAGGSIYCSLHDVNGASNHQTLDEFHVSCVRASGGSIAERVESEHHGIWRWTVDLSGIDTIHGQSRDFRADQGGPWTYHHGHDVGGPTETLGELTFQDGLWGSPDAAAAWISPRELHPGAVEDVVLKWTAPADFAAGTSVRLGGVLRDADPGDAGPEPCAEDRDPDVPGYDFYAGQDGIFGKVILRRAGGDELKFQAHVENGDTVGKSLSEANATFTIDPGDEILFVVEAGRDNRCDATAWDPSIEVLASGTGRGGPKPGRGKNR